MNSSSIHEEDMFMVKDIQMYNVHFLKYNESFHE